MSHPTDESLSALMDGETSPFETRRLYDRLCSDAETLARWERYHLIRDSLRGNLSVVYRTDFAQGVMAHVAQEPATAGHGRPLQDGRLLGSGLLRSAAGFALAASVAVFTVLGVRSFTVPSSSPVETPVAQVGSGSTQSVASESEGASQVRGLAGGGPRLNSYLVNHAEHASRQSIMPYARIVGYELDAEE